MYRAEKSICIYIYLYLYENFFDANQSMKTADKYLLDETESNMQFVQSDLFSPISSSPDAIRHMLNEVKSSMCFIMPKMIA